MLCSLFDGSRSYCQGGKQPGLEADHSSAPRAEVKNKWNYNSTLPYASMMCIWCHKEITCIIKQWDKLCIMN